MTVLGLKEAAKAAGVSRQTIYRKANNGELSTVTREDGSKGVDTSELLRVFGTVRDASTVTGGSHGRSRGTESDSELDAARQRIQELETRLAETEAARLREQEAAAAREAEAKDREAKLWATLEHERRQLEHKPEPAPAKPEGLGGMLRRLLGMGVVLMLLQMPEEAWAFRTIGVPSCGDWVESRQSHPSTAELANKSWLMGYMTGMADGLPSEVAPNLLGETDGDSLVVWMDNYCKAHPLENVLLGGQELTTELLRRQQKP